MAERFHTLESPDFHLIRNLPQLEEYISLRKELRRANPAQVPNITAGLLSVEGAHCLEGKLENVQVLFQAGVRMMSPTHFFDNQLGGSAHGELKGGLTRMSLPLSESSSDCLQVKYS